MIDFKDLRYRLEYAAFRLLEVAIRATPLAVASRGSGMAWRLIAPHLHRQKRVLDNLAAAYPETTLKQRKRIAADMWDNLGRTVAEFPHLTELRQSTSGPGWEVVNADILVQVGKAE